MEHKMSGVSRKDWPVGGEPALTKKKKEKKITHSESTYTCAWVSAMPGSTHLPVALVFPFEKTETWKIFQSHNQSVMSSDRDKA